MAENHNQKGYILKEAREAKGIGLEVVHEETKIPLDALKAIEEGYTIRTLSSFYLKGFIKMYAQYLGVDISKVIEGHKPEKLPKPVKAAPPPEEVFKERFRIFLSKRKQQEILRVVVVIVAVFLFIKIVGAVKNRRAAVKKTPPIQDKTVKRNTRTPQTQPKQSPAPQAQAKETVTPAALPGEKKNIVLSVRARKNSWLQVKSDGSVVFQAVLKEGATETWRADKQIEISGRNISQLEFELNGKLIGSLGRDDRQANKVIITRNGLSTQN